MSWSIVLSDKLPDQVANTTLVPGAGSLAFVSGPPPILLEVVPTQATSVAFTGYAPPMGSRLPIQTGGLSLSGVPPPLKTAIHLTESTGSILIVSSSPTVSQGGRTFPFVGGVFNGGDQSFGQATTAGFTSYTAAGPGTDAYTATQFIGGFDIAWALGGSFEGFANGVRNKANLVTAIKGKGNFANVRNRTHTPYVFPYYIMESSGNAASGLPYQTWTNLVRANNWWCTQAAGGTGAILPSGNAAFFEVNYGVAWGTAITGAHPVARDGTIAGGAYGSLSNGQGPARTAATYAASALLTTNVLDPRFTSLPSAGAAPNADGIFLDNCFIFPNGGGNLGAASGFWDGNNSISNATIAVYPSGAASLLSRGQFQFFQTLQSYLAQCNVGSTYYNIGNFGNYGNNVGYGDVHAITAGAMDNMFHGGLIENVAGVAGSGWQTFMSWPSVLQNYRYARAYCLSPKLVGVQVRVPDTNNAGNTIAFKTGGSVVTVAHGTALEQQYLRCMLCATLMDDGCFTVGSHNYDWAATPWYAEFGDDSLTVVNVKRDYMGTRVGSPPTAAALPNGLWIAEFQNAIACFNPWDNGVQTLTAAQLTSLFGRNFKHLQAPGSSINDGSSFTSYTFADADGLILLKA